MSDAENSSSNTGRHPALVELSRDHHKALTAAQRLIDGKLPGEEEEVPPGELARDFLAFWRDHARDHFREEEEVVLPVYGRHEDPCDNPDIRRMLNDHAWFRDILPQIRQLVEAGEEVRDLLREIGTRLRDHARLEERTIFPRVQEVLSEEDLTEMQERSEAYREESGGDPGETPVVR